MAADAPDAVGTAVVYLTGPPEPFVPEHLQGKLCCGAAFLWAGDPADGEPWAQKLRDLGPTVDLVGPMPYTQLQCMIDDPPGLRNWWTADYLAELSDAAVDVFASHSERMPVPSACQSIMFPWGGEVAARRQVAHADGQARRDLGLPPVRAVGGRGRR